MKTRKRGVSMAEVLTAVVLMSVMFGMILGIVTILRKNYSDQDKRSSMQQNAATALSRLTREVMETSYKTVSIYNSPLSDTPKGIIFASARNPAGYNKFDIDPNNAKCIWHKYVCYYLDTDPENKSENALFRKEKEISTATTTSATISDTTLTFKNAASLKSIIVAHNVGDMNFPDLGVGNFDPTQIEPKLPLKVSLTLAEHSTSNSITVTFTVNMQND